MKPRRISVPLAILVLLTCASIAFFIFFGRDFPPLMVVHHAADGRPDLWMDRVKFIVLGSFLALMLPTFIATVVGVLPRVFSPRRRAQTLDALLWLGLWLGCLVQALLLMAFIGIYRANLR